MCMYLGVVEKLYQIRHKLTQVRFNSIETTLSNGSKGENTRFPDLPVTVGEFLVEER